MSMRTLLLVPSALLLVATAASAQGQSDMRFRGMDRNGDGVITRGEWRGNDRSFRVHDWNGDGVLSGDEVNPAAQPPDRGDRARAFADLDRDGNGRIDRSEFRGEMRAFDHLDLNHDGVLTRDEFNRVTRATGTSGRVTETAAYRAGHARGLAEGRTAGRGDKASGHGWDLEGQTELEQASSGYYAAIGSLSEYQSGYRAGFRIGYREGFGPR